jgi:hypothetical protein
MLPRFIFLGILTSIFQIFLFGLLYDFAVLLHKKIYEFPHNDLGWAITLYYTFIFYGFLVAALNLVLTFLGIRKITIILLIILLIIFDTWLFLNFQYRPYKVVLIATINLVRFIKIVH